MQKPFVMIEANEAEPRDSDGSVVSLYKKIAKDRLRQLDAREKYVPASILRDTAWNILLDLYVHDNEGHGISISSACIASKGAPTTALRWIKRLEKERLLYRHADTEDKRRCYLSLTPECRKAIESWLLDD